MKNSKTPKDKYGTQQTSNITIPDNYRKPSNQMLFVRHQNAIKNSAMVHRRGKTIRAYSAIHEYKSRSFKIYCSGKQSKAIKQVQLAKPHH